MDVSTGARTTRIRASSRMSVLLIWAGVSIDGRFQQSCAKRTICHDRQP